MKKGGNCTSQTEKEKSLPDNLKFDHFSSINLSIPLKLPAESSQPE
jgi:hypothetical protein